MRKGVKGWVWITAQIIRSIVYAHSVLEAVSQNSICYFEAKYFVRLQKIKVIGLLVVMGVLGSESAENEVQETKGLQCPFIYLAASA